jgi:hypothetical protein
VGYERCGIPYHCILTHVRQGGFPLIKLLMHGYQEIPLKYAELHNVQGGKLSFGQAYYELGGSTGSMLSDLLQQYTLQYFELFRRRPQVGCWFVLADRQI